MKKHAIRRRTAHRGLTLIEILIVIGLLLVIGGLVVINVMPARDRAERDMVVAQIDQISAALEQFRLDMRRYPTEDEGLRALWTDEALEDEPERAKWRPYLRDPIRRDAWGSEWVYRYPSEIRGEGFFDLISPGPDREEGTDDDITNWDRLRGEDGEIEDLFDDFGTQ
jgi:general secretion pathway protein G